MHPGMLETGETLDEALSLQRQHDDLLRRLEAKQVSVEDLLRQADALVAEQPEPEAAVYEAMAESLGSAWKALNRQLALRSKLLQEAVAFFTSVNQYGNEMDALERHARDGFTGSQRQDQLEQSMREHERLRGGLLETATKALGEGQTVIGRIREIGPMVDNPDRPRLVAEACQKIENVMLRLSERRRRVEMSWEDRRVRLELGQRAAELGRDASLVDEWLARAEERLRKGQDLGASELSNEVLSKELESFFNEARRHEELLSATFYAAEELRRQGLEEGGELKNRCDGLRDRMNRVLKGIENRRSLLLSAAHFFAGATQSLAVLDNLQIQIRHQNQGWLLRNFFRTIAECPQRPRQ